MNTMHDPATTWIQSAAADARDAARQLALTPGPQRDAGLRAAAAALRADRAAIIEANQADVAGSTGNAAFLDRLRLTAARVEAMAKGLEDIADLPDPLERDLGTWTRPNGLTIRRVPQPLGVIGMIYESRPNVGADAAGICLKSGNCVILRGGSESARSAVAIQAAMQRGLAEAGLPVAAVQIVPDTDRSYVAAMLAAAGLIDLIIPRGGRGLVERVQRDARVPVLAHADGICHTYIHQDADHAMARTVLTNAKMRRTGICGATETLLIDSAIAPKLLPVLIDDLRALSCDFRADARACAIVPGLTPMGENDFSTEWLDAILSVGVVDGVDDALAHIQRHGSSHTEAIITANQDAAERFLRGVDSSVAMWNASTQFCDGGEFGFGAEIGIATGRVHTRGPVGPEQLTTFRYLVTGNGQVRPG